MNIQGPLRIVPSPYRDVSTPLIKYIKARREEHGAEVVTVYTPQYIVGHWWENLLHNHKARRIRQRVMLVHGVTVALVPWLLDSTTQLFQRAYRPLPGSTRRGEPPRPVLRKPLPPAGSMLNMNIPHSAEGLSESPVDRAARAERAAAAKTKHPKVTVSKASTTTSTVPAPRTSAARPGGTGPAAKTSPAKRAADK